MTAIAAFHDTPWIRHDTKAIATHSKHNRRELKMRKLYRLTVQCQAFAVNQRRSGSLDETPWVDIVM
jgi:hypothetical protein